MVPTKCCSAKLYWSLGYSSEKQHTNIMYRSRHAFMSQSSILNQQHSVWESQRLQKQTHLPNRWSKDNNEVNQWYWTILVVDLMRFISWISCVAFLVLHTIYKVIWCQFSKTEQDKWFMNIMRGQLQNTKWITREDNLLIIRHSRLF